MGSHIERDGLDNCVCCSGTVVNKENVEIFMNMSDLYMTAGNKEQLEVIRKSCAQMIADASRGSRNVYMIANTKMWDWLAEHPDKWKLDFLEATSDIHQGHYKFHECAMCTMVECDCVQCPLLDLWVGDGEYPEELTEEGVYQGKYICDRSAESPYHVWRLAGVIIESEQSKK